MLGCLGYLPEKTVNGGPNLTLGKVPDDDDEDDDNSV